MSAGIVFFDIAGPDTRALGEFYAGVFGWEADEEGRLDVPVGSPLRGALREDPVETRLYIGVEDVAAKLEEVERYGGAVQSRRFEVRGVAVLGLFTDPAGNPMGLVELEGGRPRIP